MNRFALLILTLTCYLCSVQGSANANYYFSRVDGESGLSQINVKAILQDSYGFMWFGTRNRLNRYDGISNKVYDCYDPVLHMRNNNISALYEDQKKKIWIGTDKGIYVFDPVFEKFSFFQQKTSTNKGISDWVSDIQCDLEKNIWIVIPNEGLFRYHELSEKLYHYSIGSTETPNQGGNPQCLFIEKSGTVWIGTNGNGVYLYNKSTDSFSQYLGENNGSSLRGENIYTMCDYGDELILGIHEGRLRKFNKRRNTLADVNAPEVHYKIIRHVIRKDDELWVGTDAGLFIINELENQVTHLREDPMYSHSLSDNIIEKMYLDRENGVWLGTRFGGVNHLAKKGIDFECYVPLSTGNSINNRRLRGMKEDPDGNIWIASEEMGLTIFNPKTKLFKRTGENKHISGFKSSKIMSLYFDEKQAWVGFFKNGLDIVDLKTFNIRHYSAKELNLDEASVYAICEDRFGKIWLGNGWGVFVGDKNKKDFKRLDKFGLSYVFDIMEDSKGNIWVATLGNGIFKYNPFSEKISHYLNNVNNKHSLSSNSVSDITETSLGEIWFSTDRGGICRYNESTDNFTGYSLKDGLPDDIALKIIEDKEHNLWFGTNNGLVKFNPQTKSVKVFSKKDGLPVNQFNYKSALLSSSGKLYFGGLNGLIAFDPYNFEENKFIPPVYISRLYLFNKEIDLNTENSPLEKAINYTKKITLKYNQSNIAFDFVALSYTAPRANKYAYIMEGIDKEWTYTNTNQSASYAKLAPGKYVFKVKGSNNDGIWNEAGTQLEIEILPPWWQSGLAQVIYLILIISTVYYLLNRYRKRTEKRNAEKQRLFESEKEKELYSSKVEFFTNMAHEIRTPVTLINGPLESMLEMDIKDPEINKSLHVMKRSTSELLGLVNQLLDFRKVDSNKFLLNISRQNISGLLKDIYASFESSALRQNKTISLSMPDKDIYIPLDPGALSKILNNLFTNAIRYSENNIDVALTVEGQQIIIKFRNDGDIIPAELREKIFDPFFQVNKHRNNTSSSGIGLSLAKSLTELHTGKLLYQTQDNMNEFILELPLNEPDTVSEYIPEDNYIVEEDNEYQPNSNNAEIILVVEDNPEMLDFIAGKIQKKMHFAVETAHNGKEALQILEEKNIDIILSDVMMPEMDGFELCRNVKENIEYSHIPVVLLTARNDLESKIQGLEAGADAYVEKPFSMAHLNTQLTTLMNNRKREKEAFMRKPFLPVQNIGMNKADEQFIQKVIDIIHENITDSEFNVERLAEHVFMSRSSLHRKIKALTELTPIDFIRLIRLRKSAELIQNGDYRVGEVCYLVGINSPSYFIKLFQKQFGITPKEFINQK